MKQALILATDPNAGRFNPLSIAGRRFAQTRRQSSSFPAPEADAAEVAEYHFRMGRTCWELGGDMRNDKQHAHAHFLAAAAVEGSTCQAAAFAWLGRYYRDVAQDPGKGRRCFQRALAIDPCDDIAGEPLRHLGRWAHATGGGLQAYDDTCLAIHINPHVSMTGLCEFVCKLVNMASGRLMSLIAHGQSPSLPKTQGSAERAHKVIAFAAYRV